MTQSDPRVDRMEGVLERIAAEQSEMRQDMRDLRADINTLQTRMLQLWLGTMGTMMAGFIAIFVAILLKG